MNKTMKRFLTSLVLLVINITLYAQTTWVYSNANDGFVNVRKEPSAKSKIVEILYNGKEGAILLDKSNNNWYKVEINGVTGYVNKRFIILSTSSKKMTNAEINKVLDTLNTGMTKEECKSKLGKPNRITTHSTTGHYFEEWFYYDKYYLKFDNGFLIIYANINNQNKNQQIIREFMKTH